jgi:hypothetical protein
MKVILACFLLATSWVWSHQPIEEITAYWDGESFSTKDLVPLRLKTRMIEGRSVFFHVNLLACYGHVFLDGVIPLYKMLKSYDLLDQPINLLIAPTTREKTSQTFLNVVQFLKDLFPQAKIILLSRSLFNNPLQINHLVVNERLPLDHTPTRYFAFYDACPEAWKHIDRLRELGICDNISYKEDSPDDNLVKEFVQLVKNTYHLQAPIQKNRVLISYRPTSRKILNLEELLKALRQHGYEPRCVDFETMSIKDQADETMQAEFLIGTYGSHLVNALFLHSDANVVVLWHKYAKYFWSRKYCVIHSAFLSTGVRLIEIDKPYYDPRDKYNRAIEVPEYFFRSNGMNILDENKVNMDAFMAYPLAGMYELLDVDMHIDPQNLIEVLNQYSKPQIRRTR